MRKVISIKSRTTPTAMLRPTQIRFRFEHGEMSLEDAIAAARKCGYVPLAVEFEQHLELMKRRCRATIVSLVRQGTLTVEEGLRHAVHDGINDLDELKVELDRLTLFKSLTPAEVARRNAAAQLAA